MTEAKAFNLAFMYIDDVLSINNPKFANIGFININTTKNLR